jgi:hypothetical protein
MDAEINEPSVGSRVDAAMRGYYYLAPLWLLLEISFFKGARAGLIVGNSLLGITAFYGVESAIGIGFWRSQ